MFIVNDRLTHSSNKYNNKNFKNEYFLQTVVIVGVGNLKILTSNFFKRSIIIKNLKNRSNQTN